MNRHIAAAIAILPALLPSCGGDNFDIVRDGGDTDVDGAAGSSGSGGSGGTGGEDAGDAGDADGAAGTGGDDGGDASEEYYCDPTWLPGDDPCVIDDAFGIFVSPTGEDGASCGTEGSPCASVGQGMIRAKAAGKRVYVCGDGGTFEESVVVDGSVDGLKLFGGFACGSWEYTPSTVRSHVMPASEGVAWTVDGLTAGLEVNDFAIESRTATMAGASSIAAMVRNSSGVVFRNSTLVAGSGAKGADGADGVKGADGAEAGDGQKGKPATCDDSIATNAGGFWMGSQVVCVSKGGKGGTAEVDKVGLGGDPGEPPTNVVEPGQGLGGTGSLIYDDPGEAGSPGSAGNPGANGAAAATSGALSSDGFVPADGFDGVQDGFPGQGGGGGGAGASAAGCTGASGGAGGMGGCGGKLGTGGGGGGASVALMAWSSEVTLDGSVLTAATGGGGGRGGNGGAGGARALGADGGSSGSGMASGGDGGRGGNGGPGGSGSGGTGGPSFALVFHGTAPVEQGSVVKTPGSGGLKGSGGQAVDGVKAPDGTDGDSAPVFEVP